MADGLDYSILIVANGPGVSDGVLQWLTTRPDVRIVRLKTGSHPLARRVGAELADGEFVAFLDDDDELMPGTLGRKVAFFRAHPDVEVLVTDGLRVTASTETRIFPLPEARRTDLVETMMHAGWGASSLTLRRQRVDLSALDPVLGHMEWTLATLVLARHHRFGFLDEPTYRYYETTPDSLSKSVEHHLAAPRVWRRLSKIYAGTRYEVDVRRRYGAVCHNAAWDSARLGRMGDAWRLHAASLCSPGGLAFVTFSARLLLASFRVGVGEPPLHDTSTPTKTRTAQ